MERSHESYHDADRDEHYHILKLHVALPLSPMDYMAAADVHGDDIAIPFDGDVPFRRKMLKLPSLEDLLVTDCSETLTKLTFAEGKDDRKKIKEKEEEQEKAQKSWIPEPVISQTLGPKNLYKTVWCQHKHWTAGEGKIYNVSNLSGNALISSKNALISSQNA